MKLRTFTHNFIRNSGKLAIYSQIGIHQCRGTRVDQQVRKLRVGNHCVWVLQNSPVGLCHSTACSDALVHPSTIIKTLRLNQTCSNTARDNPDINQSHTHSFILKPQNGHIQWYIKSHTHLVIATKGCQEILRLHKAYLELLIIFSWQNPTQGVHGRGTHQSADKLEGLSVLLLHYGYFGIENPYTSYIYISSTDYCMHIDIHHSFQAC